MPLHQHTHSWNLPFALVKIQLEPCASLDCGEVDDEDYYTVPEHYEDVPVDVELDMHVDFDDIEDLQHLEEEVTRLGGKDRDVTVEQAQPSRSRARTAHQLQLSKNLLSQLEDNMRLKVSQTPRPIDPNNILHLLDSILQPSTFWHSGTVARQSPGRQRQYSKMTTWTRWVRVSSNISWNVVQNQALYGYLEVVTATDARKWQAGQTKRLMENIEGLKVQQILIERRMLEVEDILDELRMEEQAVEQHRREQMELKQEMTRQQLGQQMEQSRVRSTKTTKN